MGSTLSCHCWTVTVLPDGRAYDNPVPDEHKPWCPAGKHIGTLCDVVVGLGGVCSQLQGHPGNHGTRGEG